jgi:hypothetical protein
MPLPITRINIDGGQSLSKTGKRHIVMPRQLRAMVSNFDESSSTGLSEKAAEPQYRAGYDVW